MNKKDLQRRIGQFIFRVYELARTMPQTRRLKAMGRQMIWSANSIELHYEAACKARSCVEIVAKLNLTGEAIEETFFWLETIFEAGISRDEKMRFLLKEAKALMAIIVASKKSARKNKLKMEN